MTDKVSIRRLATGVPGLDTLLGGGLPEFSFNLIAGTPGSGKTTLAHQIMFSLASPQRRALYFTVLGEPPLKMLRYQQQFSFFEFDKIDASVRFVNLAAEVLNGDFKQVLARILREVATDSPGVVFVDSFRSVTVATKDEPDRAGALQLFVQQLGMHLTSWEATTFLVGEYEFAESEANAVFTVADGLIWLTQTIHRDAMVRKMEVKKMRGQAQLPGLHTFRITNAGVQTFPRAIVGAAISSPPADAPKPVERLYMGVPRLDEMLGGGLPKGYSLLVAGPSGSGKTILATAFLQEGARRGEPGVIAAFEKSPSQRLTPVLADLVRTGLLGVIDTRSLDLDTDVTLHEMLEMIERMQAKRVVIDSLSGFELALAPTNSENFRESLYRMVAVLTARGMTVLLTSELEDRYTDLRFSPYGAAFLTDAIIVQRYIELNSELRRLIAVVKVRASAHSSELHLFEINDDGLVIGEPLSGYEGLLGGKPALAASTPASPDHGKSHER
jgi:circadian clock protein KaiC